MAGTITPYTTAAGKRYRVRYRKPDKTQTDKRGFITKRDAELFLASVTVSKASGDYIDPSLGRITVGQLAEPWLSGKRPPAMKPSAHVLLESAWRVHVQPTWGNREVRSIVPSEVKEWVATVGQDRSPSVTLRALGVLAGILDTAVDDGRIKKNVARGLKDLPRKPKKKAGRSFLTHQQVHTLAEQSGGYGLLVLTMAYTGLRWGEAVALRVRSVNQVRKRLHVQETAVQVGSAFHVGPPKTWEQRTVPVPAFLLTKIIDLCAERAPNELLFGNGTNYLRTPHSYKGWFALAVEAAQQSDRSFPRVTPHDLRHTAASLAIQSGANVKALQEMLGHASAVMTLDTYADLFDDDLDSVAERLDAAARSASVGKVWANAFPEN